MINSLKNKIALVCGSTQGIGKAIALKLAEMGCSIILVSRNEEKLQATLSGLDTSHGQKHQFLKVDFSNPLQVKQELDSFFKNHTGVHILINNSGGPKGGLIKDASIEEFISTFNQHLICNHILVQALYPKMIELGYGRIINIISTSVKQPLPNLGVSNTIRGAVASWSKTLANELGQYGITVNNILPGATDTISLKELAEIKSQKTGQSIEEIFQEMANESPMKRIAQPQEVAAAVAFLASPDASYINGINLPVDGGRTKSL